MSLPSSAPAYETKFAPLDLAAPTASGHLEGYAALFGEPDRGGDIVAPGAFADTLRDRASSVKLLWQHDPARPIGVWVAITEDSRGLHGRGRRLTASPKGREAAALLEAGALDGLSIGYRTVEAERAGPHRRLTRLELWEISLVTFPMAERARATSAPPAEDLAAAIREAARAFA